MRVIAMCAGEGRDLLGALDMNPRANLRGRLVELDPALAAKARQGFADRGLTEVDVVVGDAGRTEAYAGATPADLVLVCGVFGNISDEDIERTISALPMLCAPGATVIWTRHRRPPDLTISIRGWLIESGFEEVAFDEVPDSPGSVGVARFLGETEPLADKQLFTFVRT